MIPFPNKKYNIIYADPPWEYRKSGGMRSGRGLAKKHYNTMNVDEIMRLPIHRICDKNCYLFLWVTAPCLLDGANTIISWGFNYVTVAFTWIKCNSKNMGSLFYGMGNFTRANPEYVLLGRIGKLDRISSNIHSVVTSSIEEHSKKPDSVRNRIVRLYGNIPRIELFARQKYDGWDSWGNEVKQ